MSTSNNFLLSLQAYQEVQADLRSPEQTAVFVSPDPIQHGPLPPASLLLGMDEEDHPVTLDLLDPDRGPVLVLGDGNSGRTTLLRSLATVSDLQPDLQFGVLTPFVEEWQAQESLPGCLGIWPSFHPSAGSFLQRLLSWAEVLPDTRQAVLLLVDDLELLDLPSSARHALRCLLANGPQARLWPIVAVNAARLDRLGSLLDVFQSRVFARIRRRGTARLLLADPLVDFSSLAPGVQYLLDSPGGRMRFRLPHLQGRLP